MQIGEICKHDVVTIQRGASVVEAARLMRSEHVGDLVVVDSADQIGRVVGVVTDRDLVVELLAEDVAIDSVAIGDVASPRTVTVRDDSDVFETLRLMSVKGVRRLPVLDQDGQLCGIVNLDDILGVLMQNLGLLRDLSDRRVERERNVRG